MNTHKSIHGYLHSTLGSANKGESWAETDLYSDPLGCMEDHPEESLYKAHWDACFKGKL